MRQTFGPRMAYKGFSVMKTKSIKLFQKLAELTNKKCATCPVTEPHRCCDKMFCNLNDHYMLAKGIAEYTKPNVGGIPYMGAGGCVISPEHRPYCTGYVCPPHLHADPEFRAEYESIINKIGDDSSAPPMPDLMGRVMADIPSQWAVDLVKKTVSNE